jgi:hypothetical protein
MMKIRKRTVHSLKAVGGFFAGIELEIMGIERLKRIVSRFIFSREGWMRRIFIFSEKVCFEI